MLGSVSSSSDSRIREVGEFLRHVTSMQQQARRGISTVSATAKGLFFVHLYGAFEHTVSNSVQRTLQHIDSRGHETIKFKPFMLSVVLDPEVKSLMDVGKDKMWNARNVLFEASRSPKQPNIQDTVLPTGSGNLDYRQLSMIWSTLCVDAPVLPRMNIKGRLDEMVDNRNAISHGRESPQNVGSRNSIDDLETTFTEISDLCTHIIQSLEDYLNKKDYLV